MCTYIYMCTSTYTHFLHTTQYNLIPHTTCLPKTHTLAHTRIILVQASEEPKKKKKEKKTISQDIASNGDGVCT